MNNNLKKFATSVTPPLRMHLGVSSDCLSEAALRLVGFLCWDFNHEACIFSCYDEKSILQYSKAQMHLLASDCKRLNAGRRKCVPRPAPASTPSARTAGALPIGLLLKWKLLQAV